VCQEWYQAARSGGGFASEYRFVTADGTVSWVEGSALTLHDAAGAPTGYIGSVTDITERKIAEEKQAFLINELNHRVKNTLATVQAIAAQTFGSGDSGPESRRRFEARLIALSDAHSILTQDNRDGAELKRLILRALKALAAPNRLRLEGPPVRLSPKATVAIAMAMHELGTNAGKYGALANDAGRIAVTWEVSAKSPALFAMEWRESGGPAVEPPGRRGFGTRLIERNLAHDLDGEARLNFLSDGLVCKISAPLESICGRE
jgi:two-component sensor histidine kinase